MVFGLGFRVLGSYKQLPNIQKWSPFSIPSLLGDPRYLEDIVGGRDAEGKELSADTVRDFLKWHNEKGNLPYGHPASVSKKCCIFAGEALHHLS